MIRTELRPLLAKLSEGDPLGYLLADGRTIWLEEIADDQRSGRGWGNFTLVCDQRAREFRSFNRLPEAFGGLLGDVGLPTNLPIALDPDEWQVFPSSPSLAEMAWRTTAGTDHRAPSAVTGAVSEEVMG